MANDYDCVCSYPCGPHLLHCLEFNARRQEEAPKTCQQPGCTRGEALYGTIGYSVPTETAGVDRWVYTGSRSVKFGGF